MKTYEETFDEFENLLSEVLKTHQELGKTKGVTAFRLLFAHLVNGFDSMINQLRIITLKENPRVIRKEAKKQNKYDASPSFKNLMEIEDDGGIYKHLAKDLIENIRETYSQMKHYQKLQQLMSWLEIDLNNQYLALIGSMAGRIRKTKPTTSSSHYKTQSYKVIGYIDVTFEKRNAITHNKNEFPNHVVDRLNKKWDLEIEREKIGVGRNSLKITAILYQDLAKLLKEKCLKKKN